MPPQFRRDLRQTVLFTFTTEISPMYGHILVGGGGYEGYPEPPHQQLDGSWMAIPAWTDQRRSPTMVALYPPHDGIGPDIVTVEVIEGDFLGHSGTGAEVVFMGSLTFLSDTASGPDPELWVTAITGATIRVPFQVRRGATYQVWVEVANRQEAITRFERWIADDSDEKLPAIEHWWVTLKFLKDEEDLG